MKRRGNKCSITNLKKIRKEFGSKSSIYKQLKKRCER